MSADFQNNFPNPCKLSKTGYFGSKYVTICVSGDESNQISLKGYQVSGLGMSVVVISLNWPCYLSSVRATQFSFQFPFQYTLVLI